MSAEIVRKGATEPASSASTSLHTGRNIEEEKAVTVFRQVVCQTCNKPLESPKNCGKCKVVYYCDQTCQSEDWASHKKICVQFPDTFEIEKDQELFPKIAKCFEQWQFFHMIFHFRYKGEDAKTPPHKFRIIHNPQVLTLKAGGFQIQAPRIFAHENLSSPLVQEIST